jgi:hypothetical protein
LQIGQIGQTGVCFVPVGLALTHFGENPHRVSLHQIDLRVRLHANDYSPRSTIRKEFSDHTIKSGLVSDGPVLHNLTPAGLIQRLQRIERMIETSKQFVNQLAHG